MIFDTHAHYDSRKFNADREELMNQLVQEGIGRVVDIGADIESTRKAMELAKSMILSMQQQGYIQVKLIVWMNGVFSG